jgi:hypothetical protein
MASSTQWKLRRLAGRVIRIIQRRKASSPVIGAYEGTTVPKARAFTQAYDRTATYAGTYRKEMNEGRNAVGVLLTAMRAWIPLVARDVSGLIASVFGDQPNVPDDVIDDAERLITIIDLHRNAADEPLPYREAALAQLTPALESAAKEWQEAESADKTYQDLLQTVRAAADAFDVDLIALRRSLIAVGGRNDKDYQKLRAIRAAAADEDDDADGPPPSTVVPAEPGDPPPR